MTIRPAVSLAIALAISGPVATQSPSASLRQIIPGHYVYAFNDNGRLFNSGIVATSVGALVFDALETEAVARAERQAIAQVTKQPVRYLVSRRSTIRSAEATAPTPTYSESGTSITARA
jgi:hypothetical protein